MYKRQVERGPRWPRSGRTSSRRRWPDRSISSCASTARETDPIGSRRWKTRPARRSFDTMAVDCCAVRRHRLLPRSCRRAAMAARWHSSCPESLRAFQRISLSAGTRRTTEVVHRLARRPAGANHAARYARCNAGPWRMLQSNEFYGGAPVLRCVTLDGDSGKEASRRSASDRWRASNAAHARTLTRSGGSGELASRDVRIAVRQRARRLRPCGGCDWPPHTGHSRKPITTHSHIWY